MSCNICLQNKDDLILWHLPLVKTHANHASCNHCISTEIFHRMRSEQIIKCPTCRVICLIEPSLRLKTPSSYNLLYSSISTVAVLSIRYLLADMSAFFLKCHNNSLISFDIDQWIHLSADMDYFGFKDFRSHRIKEVMREHLVEGKKAEIISYISEYISLKHISAISAYCLTSIAITFMMSRNYPLKSSLKGGFEQCFHLALNLWIIHYFKTDYSDFITCSQNECDPYSPPFYNASKAQKNALELFSLFAVAIVIFVIKFKQINQESENDRHFELGALSVEEIKNLFNRKIVNLKGTTFYEM